MGPSNSLIILAIEMIFFTMIILSHCIQKKLQRVKELMQSFLQGTVKPWPDRVVGLSRIHQMREVRYGVDESARYRTEMGDSTSKGTNISSMWRVRLLPSCIFALLSHDITRR